MNSGQQFYKAPLAMPGNAVSLEEPLWYAIHTRARHEGNVAGLLVEKGVTAYLPLISEVHHWSDRRKVVETPLFSCYAFVQLPSFLGYRLRVLQNPGVIGFVGIRGMGIPIPAKQIEDIKTLLEHEDACTAYPFLKVGRRVRIRGGSLAGVEGILVGKNADQSLVVSIELIQRSVAVRIEGYEIEAI
jgi:transcription antitermination factor NusG